MKYCHACGAQLVPDAAFCSHCGTRIVSIEEPASQPAAAPPAVASESTPVPPDAVTPAPVVPASPPVRTVARRPWWVVPALVIGLIVVAAFVLMAMPFGSEAGSNTTAVSETDDQTESIVQVVTDAPPPVAALPPNVAPNVSPGAVPPTAMTNTVPMVPPATTGTMPVPTNRLPASTTSMPPPTSTLPVPTSPASSQTQPPPQDLPRNESGELTASAATARLLGYIRSTNYYNTDPECVRAVNQGYENEGYTLEVWEDCGQERRLGRWRVDAKKGDVFRQNEDGRYLDP